MESYFAVMFEDVRYEQSLIFLQSLADPDNMRQSKITDYEINFSKNLALEKLQRQRNLKEELAMSLLESQLDY